MWKSLVFCAASIFAFASCEDFINEDYDLNKDIDLDINILKGITVPVGNVSKLVVSDLLDMNLTEGSLVKSEENGDLFIEYGASDYFLIDHQMDFYSISSDKPLFEPIVIDFPLSNFQNPGYFDVPYNLLYSQLTGAPLSATSSINYEFDVPSEIVDIDYIDFFSEPTLKILASEGKVTLKSGFKINFPENVVVQNYYEAPEFVVEDLHTIVLQKDIQTPAALKIFFNRIYISEGDLVDGHLTLELPIEITGDLYVNTADVAGITNDIQLTISAENFSLSPTSAALKLDMDLEPEGIDFEINNLPDFVTEGNAVLDIDNPSMYLAVNNWLDIPFGFETTIKAKQSGSTPSITLGHDPKITLAAQSWSKYMISRKPIAVESDVTNIVEPAMGDFFMKIPQMISIDDMKVSINPSDDFFRLSFNQAYQISYDYAIRLPFTFGENLNFTYAYDVDVTNVKISAAVEHAQLTMELVNSIPLSFDLDVEAIDYNGEVVEGINFELDAHIASGTQDSPVTTPITATLSTQKSVQLGGIRLVITASAPSEEHLGVSLNANQGIELKNIVLNSNEGITIDAGELL